jgi:hypothetical protein
MTLSRTTIWKIARRMYNVKLGRALTYLHAQYKYQSAFARFCSYEQWRVKCRAIGTEILFNDERKHEDTKVIALLPDSI